MYRTGHSGAALLAYAPLGFATLAAGLADLALLGGACALALATLPDVDQRLPGVAHRGPTHTVWFALAVGGLVGATGVAVAGGGPLAAVGVGAFGFAVGTLSILSHVAADALTPMGVTPFTPFRDDHYTYDVVKAKNPVANAALLALGVAATAAAAWAATLVAGV
ncbi:MULTISPECIES: metal-dependent hydrolase [Salinibaculum]|uniref:metal-dependent hydrolase n=1 Tax=Salinibaculum TaxID=2732368 RepID=UPI0030D10160